MRVHTNDPCVRLLQYIFIIECITTSAKSYFNFSLRRPKKNTQITR